MLNGNEEGVIWERNTSNNFELCFCHERKKFFITQITFGITSEISKQAAFKLCNKSSWPKNDYERFFN